jgi:hypothetical protein
MVVAEAWLATGAGLADACLLWSIGTDADTASAWRGTGGEPARCWSDVWSNIGQGRRRRPSPTGGVGTPAFW